MLFLSFWGDWGLLFLRLALGAVFIVHGWPKLKQPKQAGRNFDGMGFRPGLFWAVIVALLEFFGGILLVLGLYAQPIAALFIVEFFVIVVWKISKRNPFVGGWELDLVILVAAVMLFTAGAGALSLDRYFWLAAL